MYFKSLCPELPFDFPKRGRILFLPSIAIDICRLSLVIKESERQQEKTGMNSSEPFRNCLDPYWVNSRCGY
jgi:hypothetical protein